MEADNPLGAVKGQKVKVVLAPQIYLKASIILYGIPMVAMVAGAILGKNAGYRLIEVNRIPTSGRSLPA